MIRRFILFIGSLFVLFGSLTAGFATLGARDFQLRGYVDAAREQQLPFRIPRLGVNADLTQYDENDLPQQLELMQQAHITWIRQFVSWDQLEPQPGIYQWDTWDRIVDAVDTVSGLRLVVVLMNSPEWARSSAVPSAPPDKAADFGRFAGVFARRYGQSVDYYQIWDEPNLTEAWGGQNPRPVQYAALLQSAYDTIHSSDSHATVIAAALAPTVEQGPQNISDLRYLEMLYALDAQDYMDVVAAKPYGFSYSPLDRIVLEDRLNFSRIIALRELMQQHDDGQTSLWASAWGWNSLPQSWTGTASIWGSVEPDLRIDYTLQALDRAEAEWPWLGAMILYHWQPDAPSDDPIWGFALIDQNGLPTRLWHALVDRKPASAASNGHYPAANPHATYDGVWTFGALGADIGWINDSRFSFDFEGSDIGLLLREDDYVAYLYPTIDGEPANATPFDVAGHAYIVLTSDTRKPVIELAPVAQNLMPGLHTLDVTAYDLVPDEAQDRWALVGYAVSAGDLHAPYNRQILIAAYAALVGFAAAVVTGRSLSWQRLRQPLDWLSYNMSSASQIFISAVTSVALMLGMLLTWDSMISSFFRREPVHLGAAILTAGVLYLQPGLILTLISLVLLLFMFYHRLDIGLALTVFWTPFFLFPVQLYQFAFPMSEALILITAAAWILRLLVGWGRLRQSANSQFPIAAIWTRLDTLDWAVVVWFALGAMTLFWAEYRAEAMTELRTIILEPALFYFIIRGTLHEKKSQILVVDALLLAAFTVAVIGLILFLRGESIITAEDGVPRLAAVYGSPNNLSLFLGRCIPIALAYLLWPVDRKRRIVSGLILGIMVAALLLSQSAGALFIGVPVAVAAVFLFVWGRRVLLPLAGLASIAVLGLFIALRSARFARLLDFSSGTNFIRLRVWHSALNIIRDHPLSGIGLDQFLYAFRGAYISPDAWQEPDLSHPHNIFLDFWIRLGAAGLLVLFWMQAVFWLRANRAYRSLREVDPHRFALSIGLMGSMINLLGHGLVDNSVFLNDLAFVFMLLLALMNNLANVRAIDVRNNIMV